MARVTVTEVKAVIPNSSASDETIQAAIDAANILVNKIAAGCASGLTEEELTSVELYLSAHFVTVSDPGSSVSEEKFENSSRKYNVAQQGKGVLGTPFGQTANMLSGGCLQELDKRKPLIRTVGITNNGWTS